MSTHRVAPSDLRNRLEEWYASYAAIVDEKKANAWVDLFTTQGLYAVGTQNNISSTGAWWYTDRGPVILKERAAYTCGYHQHNPTRTLLTVMNIRGQMPETDVVAVQAAFVLYVIDRTGPARLHVVGRYADRLTLADGQLRYLEHRVVIEGETVPANMGVLL